MEAACQGLQGAWKARAYLPLGMGSPGKALREGVIYVVCAQWQGQKTGMGSAGVGWDQKR